jgi:hypothetical protein
MVWGGEVIGCLPSVREGNARATPLQRTIGKYEDVTGE